jgi:hypothetical protein
MPDVRLHIDTLGEVQRFELPRLVIHPEQHPTPEHVGHRRNLGPELLGRGNCGLSLDKKILSMSGEILEQIRSDGRSCQPLNVAILHVPI